MRESALVSHTVANEIILSDDKYWIVCRHELYGPFDYQWAPGMEGIELTYRGIKYGEICGMASFQADLKEFRLPLRVVQVASLTAGCLIFGLLNGLPEESRVASVQRMLRIYGWGRFVNHPFAVD